MTTQLAVPTERGNPIPAIAALITGILAVSFAAIFIRISEQDLGPFATVANRFWIATLALGVWVGFKRLQADREPHGKKSHSLSREDWGLLSLAGLITTIDLSLWAISLTHTTIANAAVLGNLAPLFTALGSWFLWRQRFNFRYWGGMVLSLGGALIIGISDFELGHIQGDAIALLSAVFFSAYLLTLEQLRTRLPTVTILLSCSAIASVVSTAIVLRMEDHFFPATEQGWLAVLGLALVSQTIGQSLVTYSLNTLSSGLVAITFLLEPVIAAIIAWFLFAETLSPLNEIGFSIVIFGVYIALSSQSAMNPTHCTGPPGPPPSLGGE